MTQPHTDFWPLAAATAVFGVVVIIIQNFARWLWRAWQAVRKGETVPISIEEMFGMTGLVVVCLVGGLVVIPLAFGLAEYAIYISGFLMLLFGVGVVLVMLLRDAFRKITK
jgi:hypothetical protein